MYPRGSYCKVWGYFPTLGNALLRKNSGDQSWLKLRKDSGSNSGKTRENILFDLRGSAELYRTITEIIILRG